MAYRTAVVVVVPPSASGIIQPSRELWFYVPRICCCAGEKTAAAGSLNEREIETRVGSGQHALLGSDKE